MFDDMIRSLPQVIAAEIVAGETDYLLRVVARDVTELQNVLASLATRGGQRLVTYLRLAEIKPPSRLPLAPLGRPARRRSSRRTKDPDGNEARLSSRSTSQLDGAADAGHRAATDPHLAVGVARAWTGRGGLSPYPGWPRTARRTSRTPAATAQ